MTRRVLVVVFGGACGLMPTNPPPQYPQSIRAREARENPPSQYSEPSAPPGQGGSIGQPGDRGPPGPPPPGGFAPTEPLPIDPDKEMPKGSLATDATLELDREGELTIDGRSDLFSAGKKSANAGRQGVLPAAVTLVAGGGAIVFTDVKGRVGCVPGASEPADGGSCAGGNTTLVAADWVSDIVASERTLFLAGVFLGHKPGNPPKGLDFSNAALGTAFERLEPKLGQSFFIGDGMTGGGASVPQKFVIPPGATKLYLGYADGFGFQGKPGYYGDNKGGLVVRLVQRR